MLIDTYWYKTGLSTLFVSNNKFDGTKHNDMKISALYIPTSRGDLVRRSALRIGWCAVPYLVIACLWSVYRDDRLLHGWWFFWCVVVISVGGLLLDLWRLLQAPDGASQNVEPGAPPNGGPAPRSGSPGATAGPPSVS
jgi:hypothetical protein